MITVEIEKQCGCFKKSGMEPVQTFNAKADARKEAEAMVEDMNETFCQKHIFSITEEDDKLIIKMNMRD